MRRSGQIRTNEHGFTLVFAVLAATAGAIVILGISRLYQRTSHELTYLAIMDHTFTLSETGLNKAIGTLVYNPGMCSDPSFTTPHTYPEAGPGEVYSNQCLRRDKPQTASYFLITSATVTVSGKSYSQILYSYVGISNVSDYFAAINGDLQISFPTDIGAPPNGGKVYAQNLLKFDTGTPNPPQTVLERAEFYKTVDPPFTNGTDWSANSPDPRDAVNINDAANNHSPVQLANPILFPQITTGDLTWYKSLAQLTGNHTVTSNFSGDVYPPGYAGFDCTPGCPATDTSRNRPNDNYVGHTNDNREHVYYFNGDIHIGVQGSTTVIHGQVLFVATGKVILDSSVRSVFDPTDTYMPGAGATNLSSSTAHQAVYITGPTFNVEISTYFYVAGQPNPQIEFIEGLSLAPTGTINCINYKLADGTEDFSTESNLGLQFTGSMILGKVPNFRNVFTDPNRRTYRYMATLKTNPPPYLPALSVIFNEFPDITSQTGVFN